MNKIFSPEIYSYQISRSKHEVISKFQEIFKPRIGLWSNSDFIGSCSNDSFTLNLVSPAFTRGPRIGSSLIGTVFETNANESIIEIQISRSPRVFALIILFFVFGIILFIQFLNRENSFDFLLWSLGGFILAPLFVLWLSAISSDTLKERFELFLKKEFIDS